MGFVSWYSRGWYHLNVVSQKSALSGAAHARRTRASAGSRVGFGANTKIIRKFPKVNQRE